MEGNGGCGEGPEWSTLGQKKKNLNLKKEKKQGQPFKKNKLRCACAYRKSCEFEIFSKCAFWSVLLHSFHLPKTTFRSKVDQLKYLALPAISEPRKIKCFVYASASRENRFTQEVRAATGTRPWTASDSDKILKTTNYKSINRFPVPYYNVPVNVQWLRVSVSADRGEGKKKTWWPRRSVGSYRSNSCWNKNIEFSARLADVGRACTSYSTGRKTRYYSAKSVRRDLQPLCTNFRWRTNRRWLWCYSSNANEYADLVDIGPAALARCAAATVFATFRIHNIIMGNAKQFFFFFFCNPHGNRRHPSRTHFCLRNVL